MRCKHYMVRSAAAKSTVLDTATVSEALAKMVKHHMQQQLVVRADDTYVGEITSFTLAKMLMPGDKPQTAEEERIETVADVDDRIAPHLGRRVADFVDPDTPVVFPETPLSEALRMFATGKLRLPVLDPETKKLVGVISPLTVLRRYQF
ncbi:MAG: CBS domain-containing protein [Rhodospirillales bacterium]|nr:CBS domain-containing protein [Rhodospirillales bacterium]